VKSRNSRRSLECPLMGWTGCFPGWLVCKDLNQRRMSLVGQKRTSARCASRSAFLAEADVSGPEMDIAALSSVIGGKADVNFAQRDVRFWLPIQPIAATHSSTLHIFRIYGPWRTAQPYDPTSRIPSHRRGRAFLSHYPFRPVPPRQTVRCCRG
jgi:hypothetical protein